MGTQRIFEAGAQAGKGLEQALAVGQHMEAEGAEAADLAVSALRCAALCCAGSYSVGPPPLLGPPWLT